MIAVMKHGIKVYLAGLIFVLLDHTNSLSESIAGNLACQDTDVCDYVKIYESCNNSNVIHAHQALFLSSNGRMG